MSTLPPTPGRTRTDPLPPTPGQTVGPFFAYALPYDDGPGLIPPHLPAAVQLHGTVYDGAGAPVPDAMLEIWQPDGNGHIPTALGSLHRDGRTFTGFGRCATRDDGTYAFTTVVPGEGAGGTAPFIAVVLFARGLMNKLHTRIYLPQYAAQNQASPFLQGLDPADRDTMTAVQQPDGSLRYDIHLQGDHETVFLAFD